MFEKLIALFERFVVAQEKCAEMLEKHYAIGLGQAYGASAPKPPVEIPAPPAPESTPGPQTAQEVVKQADLDEWNPYDADLQKAYRSDKQAILDAELAVLGIDGTGMTGAQKHEAILNHNAARDEAEDSGPAFPPEENPDFPEEPQAEADNPFDQPAPVLKSSEEFKSALRSWADSQPDRKAAYKQITDTLTDRYGVSRVTDVPEDKVNEAYAAITEAV